MADPSAGDPFIDKQQANKGGRPSDHVWNYFVRDGDYTANPSRKPGCRCKAPGCKYQLAIARLEDMRRHVAQDIAREDRQAFLKEEAKKVKTPAADSTSSTSSTSSRPTKAVKRQHQSGISDHFMSEQQHYMSKGANETANQALLRFIVSSGLSFRAVEDPFFLAFTRILRDGFEPASE
jgi:hypothetical protein